MSWICASSGNQRGRDDASSAAVRSVLFDPFALISHIPPPSRVSASSGSLNAPLQAQTLDKHWTWPRASRVDSQEMKHQHIVSGSMASTNHVENLKIWSSSPDFIGGGGNVDII